jgi:hypothetical protein
MPPKKEDDGIPFDELKEGGLRKQMKVGKDHKFKIGELTKANKTEVGKEFDFHGKMLKMTPLMKKRITLAISLLRLPKK